MNLSSPCMGCEKRFFICHDSCNEYAAFKSDSAEIAAARQEYKDNKSIEVETSIRQKKHRIHL